MTDLEAHGLSVSLPTGWEGRVFRRPTSDEPASDEPTPGVAAQSEGMPAPAGETTNVVVHIATIALPPGVGDFASDAVDRLGRSDALIVLFEYDRDAATQPLFARAGLPRELQPSDFSPSVLQRSLRGQAGVQIFFHEAGRAFCLYVVLGAYDARAQVVPEVNRVLATLTIEGGVEPLEAPR